ncbi:unnamed protein product [Candidula unifasciata]|uniref:MBD domain-containing protein n=1 Tax=Candidula unifasciata TaxID=100452 RepID=A0A8S3ZU14_9EUPU|nr:unnamed protein product [Candidula unifasciata]
MVHVHKESLVFGMAEVGSKSALNAAQFVDESAVEIDIADDDDVVELREIRVDSVNTLDSLRHQRGDELTKHKGLQFEATVPDQVVESELITHPVTSQLFPQTETHPNLSFHRPHEDVRENMGNVQKVLNDSSTANDHFVGESAVVIDVADDDSVVVITDDSDSDENTERSPDVLNLPKNTSGSHNNVVSNLQVDSSSEQASSPTTTFRQLSTDVATILLDKMPPVFTPPQAARKSRWTTTPESCNEDLLLEYNLQHLKTVISSDSATSPTIMLFNESDLEHLQKPFTCGWRRELVCRRHSKDRICDVYYKSPEGRKLRSKVELSAYLNSVTNSPVNLTHFTFKRVLLFYPPMESVRLAFSRRSQKPAGQSSSPEKKPQVRDRSSAGHVPTKHTPTEHLFTDSTVGAEHLFTDSTVGATGPLDSLSSVATKSYVVGQDVAHKIDRLSTPMLNIPEPSLLSQSENVTLNSERPILDVVKKRYRKRMHESSPE